MAGSRKSVQYEADNGSTYAITVDESNIEMIMGAQVPANGSDPRLPKGTEPRKVRVKNNDGTIARLIPVLNPTRYGLIDGATAFTLGAVDSDVGVAVRISQKIAEKTSRIPSDFDSGRQDGDAT